MAILYSFLPEQILTFHSTFFIAQLFLCAVLRILACFLCMPLALRRNNEKINIMKTKIVDFMFIFLNKYWNRIVPAAFTSQRTHCRK